MVALLSFVIIIVSDRASIRLQYAGGTCVTVCWFMICNKIHSVSAQLPSSRNLAWPRMAEIVFSREGLPIGCPTPGGQL